MQSNVIKVKARIWPRDFTDILLGLPTVVLYQILPSAVVYLLTRSSLLACVTYIVIWFTFLAFTVWSIRLSETGIQFVRLFGRPRFIRWEEIIEISEVSRREVIIHGWLWPRFPMREMTPSFSALRHFSIRWGNDCCYYPPDDAESFLRLINEFQNKTKSATQR